MKYPWMNKETGEVFKTLPQGIKTAIKDFFRIKACRTWKMFRFERID